MCGFVGIVHLESRPVERPMLAQMARAIAHRGPDGEGVFVDGSVGFHHKRLAIIDLHSGQQPMTRDRVTVVFNGEIYNYVELREGLVARGHRFDTSSDTEVLLRMYLEHGEECVRQLNGMFAFLIYDARTGQVLAARDHFGIKPLYCFQNRDLILFGSEIKAILQHPAARAEADLDGLRDYVTFQFVLGERTLFRNVRKLAPGHYQIFDIATGRSRSVKYWEPRFEIDNHHNEEYFASSLRAILEDAIRLQLRSDVPVGAHLSGGMDSSLVTALAAGRYPGRLKTFTGRFLEGPQFDESRYAKEAANATGAEWFDTVCTVDEFVELLPTLIYHMDEPAAGPGLFPQFIVSRLAAKHVKVCLGGQGGDEIFGGYARYVVAYFEQAMKSAIYESDEGGLGVELAAMAPNLNYIRQYVPMLGRLLQRGLFEPAERRYFTLMDRSEGTLDAYSAEFRAQYDREAVFGRFASVFNEADTRSYYNKMLYYDMMTGLPSLLHVEDRVSMAVSLESRVPLLDPRIVELVARVPPTIKFKGGEMKYLFKQAIQGVLPDSVMQRRDKMGFPVPLQLWARGKAREFFNEVLLSQRTRERGLFDVGTVNRLINQESAFSRVLWGLLQIELWHRQFIDAA